MSWGEDEYNVFSKPLFDRDQAAKSVYRPSRGEGEDLGDSEQQVKDLRDGANKRFKPDSGFAGTDATGPVKRDGPVAFEMGLTAKK